MTNVVTWSIAGWFLMKIAHEDCCFNQGWSWKADDKHSGSHWYMDYVHWNHETIHKNTIAGCWFGTMEFYDFPFSWECHHPNWLSHFFQRGRYTTNKLIDSKLVIWVYHGYIMGIQWDRIIEHGDFRGCHYQTYWFEQSSHGGHRQGNYPENIYMILYCSFWIGMYHAPN